VAELDSGMLTIEVNAETSVDPAAVIEAARDFSERRPTIWPNVKAGHFEVHASGAAFVEATEYLWPLGFYERCRYEWPEADHVRATVLDSNALTPGSTWDLRVIPIEGGTRVETVFERDFTRTGRSDLRSLHHRFSRRGSSGRAGDLPQLLQQLLDHRRGTRAEPEGLTADR
jgi:hypothetical protein